MPLYYSKQESYVGTTTTLMEFWVSEERSARDADNSSSLLCAKKAVMLCFKARWLYALKPSDTEVVDSQFETCQSPEHESSMPPRLSGGRRKCGHPTACSLL